MTTDQILGFPQLDTARPSFQGKTHPELGTVSNCSIITRATLSLTRIFKKVSSSRSQMLRIPENNPLGLLE
ncbi:hypothetical protein HZ326_9731 [Fusarium oxysporum f. sp. albedinis]|nr:hypothetical protein HZ326_9731 [Fusarium oxysporum f. sp. albedinis]